MNHGDWHYGMSGGSWWWMAFMMVAFWGGLIWIVVTLIQRRNHTPHPQTPGVTPFASPRQTPHEILAERLARGEIEPDDYRLRLNALQTTRE